MNHQISQLTVDFDLARQLTRFVEKLPDFDYIELCEDEDRQQAIYEQARHTCGHALDDLIATVQHQVTTRPYSAWLRGLTLDERTWILIVLSLGLGQLARPTTDDTSAHITSSAEPVIIKNSHSFARLHTDATNWDRPNDLTLLACFAADQQGGGHSVILDVDTILEIVAGHAGVIEALKTPLPWTISQIKGAETHYYPILDEAQQLRWLRRNIEVAQDWGKGQIDPSIMSQVAHFDDLVENTDQRLIFGLDAHDILIMNNRKVIHGRTSIKGLSTSQRRFQRTRLFFRPA